LTKPSIYNAHERKMALFPPRISLLYFWLSGNGYALHGALARHLQSSAPGVGYAIDRGKAIARDNNYQLVDIVF